MTYPHACPACWDDGDDCAHCGKVAGGSPRVTCLHNLLDCPECGGMPVISLVGQTRKCPICLIEGVVVMVNCRMNATSMVTLDCAHACNVPNDPPSWASTAADQSHKDTMTHKHRSPVNGNAQGWLKKECAACDSRYETIWSSHLGDLCIQCRNVFQAQTDAQAEVVVDMMDMLTPTQREKRVSEETARWVAGGRRHIPLDNANLPATNHTVTQQQNRQLGPAVPATPPPDPIKVAEAVRTMINYGQISDTFTPDPQRPTAYVIAKNGLFEVRTSPYATITTRVQQLADAATGKLAPVSIPGVTVAWEEGVKLNLPKLPWEFLRQTMAFFREVCVRAGSSSEAIVQLWYDRALDGEGQPKGHFIHVPEQRVSGASVNHTARFDEAVEQLPDDGGARYIYIGDIHSHGSSMDGFWSATDNGDESRKSEGQVFGVIGQVNDAFPSWKWRMRVREGYITLNPSNLFDVEDVRIPFTVTTGVLLDAASDPTHIKGGQVSLHCPVNLFKDVTCPVEWHAQVNAGVTGGTGRVTHMGSHSTTDHRRHHTPLQQIIFIQDGEQLVEYELNGSVRKATGRVIKVPRIDHPAGN